MKKILMVVMSLWSLQAFAQTFPVNNLTVAGSSSFAGPSIFSISPTAPTPPTGDSTTKLATTNFFTVPGPIGSVTPNSGSFTSLTASGAVAGAGFITLVNGVLAAPPAIGSTTPNSGAFTSVTQNSTTTGTVTSGPVIVNPFSCTDTVTITGGIPIMDCFRVGQQFGGSSVRGVRQAIEGYATLTAPTGNPVGVGYYVGGSFTSEAASPDGGINTTLASTASSGASSIVVNSASGIVNGSTLTIQLNTGVFGTSYEQVTAGVPSGTTIPISPTLQAAANAGNSVQITKGEIQGAIDQAILDSAATNFDVVTGHEVNITVAAAAPPRIKSWLQVINNGADAAEGTQWDSAIGLSSSSSTVHSRYGILYAPYGGFFPVDATGTLIGAFSGAQGTGMYQVANGIDFTGIQVNNVLFGGVVNSTNVAGSTNQPGFAIQGNLSGGSAETDFVNTDQAANASFIFKQKTAPTTALNVFTISAGGNISSPGTGVMPLYTTGGAGVNTPHSVIGSVTLSGGSGTITFSGTAVFGTSTSYVCTANDASGANAVSVQNQSGTQVKFVGTGSDIIPFICMGS